LQRGELTQLIDESRWQAVLQRDGGFDGEFVYGVSSTGIYCRPSCPARRPTRSRVSFFDTPVAAEAAGYRPCRRCEPRSRETAGSRLVKQVREYLDTHPDETVTLERLGQLTRSSPFHLQRTFKRVLGLTPKAYADARRLERMKSELRKGNTVTRATYEAGYGSASRAYEHGNGLGMTPGSYRKGGRGMTIKHAVVPTPLGQLLVAATERGLCSVMLGDKAEDLESTLRREYPAADIQPGNGELREYTTAILRLLEGEPGPVPPLDLSGTAFQRQVWDALRRIPPGRTRSYGAIAAEVGRPTSARAVARACASNPVAVVIPCHRVIGKAGELGGYRWGVSRKQRLLERERAAALDRN
jgi:AraC family transcriptional regulator of adaptative response/methylated-DNA-[protein]-cysteine methyltransferase